jgi:hypothetical protein
VRALVPGLGAAEEEVNGRQAFCERCFDEACAEG